MFKIKDKFICRQCVNDFSLIEYINRNDNKFFYENNVFQEMLLVANPQFFNTLNEQKISKNSTFRNYVKRSVTRPTPFGLFSSVGIGSFTKGGHFSRSETDYIKKISVEGRWISSVCMMLEDNESILLQLSIQWNQKVVDLLDKYRLNDMNYWGEAEISKDIYIKKTALLEFIRKITYRTEVIVSDLIQMIQTRAPHIETEEILTYLNKLITCEFIFTNLRMVVTDGDYLDNLISILNGIEGQSRLTEQLLQIRFLIEQYAKLELGEGIFQNLKICEKMSKVCEDEEQRYLKIDLLNDSDIFLSEGIIADLEDFINFISRINLSKDYRNKELKLYTDKFVEKYGEYVEIPVKQLLDRNFGLGVPKFLSEDKSELISNEERSFLSYLSKEIYRAIKNNQREIDISNIPSELLYANSGRFDSKQLEVYCEIKEVGGQTTVSIVPNTGSDMIGKTIGRFASYFSNSDIDLDSQIDNVELIEFPKINRNLNVMSSKNNHRKKLMLTYDTKFDGSSLELDYLGVGVKQVDNRYKLYFRELRTNSIVNFVTTSMLNYKSAGVFSDLARFLLTVSIGWQDNPFSLFRLIETFDYSPYIPRIKYKNIILTEERWILAKEDRRDFASINQWKKEFSVPNKLYFNKDDERLFINLENSLDVQWLLKQKNEKLFFTRFDELDGKSSEFVFGFENQQNDSNHSSLEKKPVRRISNDFYKEYVKTFSSDWIYFKLYGINLLGILELKSELLILVAKLLNENLIRDFHFVNYNDNGNDSLRLRFKVTSGENFRELRHRVINWIDFMLIHGFCKDASFNLYEREIERYGGIENTIACERLFSVDSYLTLKQFSYEMLDINEHISVLHSVFTYIELLNISLKQLLELMRGSFTKVSYRKQFKKLFPNNSRVITEFNKYFENRSNSKLFENILKSFPIENIHLQKQKEYFHSLLHMHMNRISVYPPKEREYLCFVIYIAEALENYEQYNK